MTECYRCGQEGHTRAHCPAAEPPPPAAPARSRAAAPPILRAVPDPALTRKWVDHIRETLGYPPRDEGDTT